MKVYFEMQRCFFVLGCLHLVRLLWFRTNSAGSPGDVLAFIYTFSVLKEKSKQPPIVHAPPRSKRHAVTHGVSMITSALSGSTVALALLLTTHWNHKWAPRQTWKHINWSFCSFSANRRDLGIKVGLLQSSHLHFCKKQKPPLSAQSPLLLCGWRGGGEMCAHSSEGCLVRKLFPRRNQETFFSLTL